MTTCAEAEFQIALEQLLCIPSATEAEGRLREMSDEVDE
jgi:hypothetical protein